MDRREFVTAAATGCGMLVLGGGLWGRMVYARNARADQLIRDARPVLSEKVHQELNTLPASVREQIRTWFHAPALNAAEYVRHICSAAFAEKLAACQSEDEKELCLLNAFVSKVVSEGEILNRVQIIAEEVGADLDRNWSQCCGEISKKWQVHITEYGSSISDDLTTRVQPMIRAEIQAALLQSKAAAQRQALGETFDNIGESAIMLLPLIRLSIGSAGVIGVPLFVLLAFRDIYKFVIGRLENRVGDYQLAITDRVSLLGNRLGAEFESEIKRRLVALHQWQESALIEAADEYARETVTFI